MNIKEYKKLCYIYILKRWTAMSIQMWMKLLSNTVNVVILTSSKFDDFLVRDNWWVLIMTNFWIIVRVIYLWFLIMPGLELSFLRTLLQALVLKKINFDWKKSMYRFDGIKLFFVFCFYSLYDIAWGNKVGQTRHDNYARKVIRECCDDWVIIAFKTCLFRFYGFFQC